MFPVDRQLQAKSHALVRIVLCGKHTAMLFNDLRGHSEPKARAIFLGGEKWIEDMIALFGRDSAAFVPHGNRNASVPSTGLQMHRASALGSLNRINDQVQQ